MSQKWPRSDMLVYVCGMSDAGQWEVDLCPGSDSSHYLLMLMYLSGCLIAPGGAQLSTAALSHIHRNWKVWIICQLWLTVRLIYSCRAQFQLCKQTMFLMGQMLAGVMEAGENMTEIETEGLCTGLLHKYFVLLLWSWQVKVRSSYCCFVW